MSNVSEWLVGLIGGSDGWQDIFLLVVKSSLLMFAAIIIQSLMRRRSPALRHLVLRSGLVGVVLVTIMWLAVPSWRLPMPGFVADAWTATAAVFQSPTAPGVHSRIMSHPPLWQIGLISLWLAGCLIVAVRMARGIFLVNRIVKTATEDTSPEFIKAAASISQDLNIRSKVRYFSSDKISVPIVWGSLRPVVILPRDWAEWTPEQCDMILRHELAHVRRRDVLWLNLASLVTVIHWFSPAAWIIKRRLNLESEYACDDQVLTVGVEAREYARHLLLIAREMRHSESKTYACTAFLRHAELEGRIMSILAHRKRGAATAGTSGVVIVTATVMLMVLMLAGFSLQSYGEDSIQDQDKDTTAPAEKAAPGPEEWIPYDNPPEQTYEEAPIYPEAAHKAGIEGRYRSRRISTRPALSSKPG